MATPEPISKKQADRLIADAERRRNAKLKALYRDFAPEGAAKRKSGVDLPGQPALEPYDKVQEPIAKRIEEDFAKEVEAIVLRIRN